MNKCYICGGKMKKITSKITVHGKSAIQNVTKCNSCGKGIVSSEEYERARKQLKEVRP